MRHRRRGKLKKYVYRPAVEDAKPSDKGTVVSLQRYRWKLHHDMPHERVIRVVRFVWMRTGFLWSDRFKLHAYWLGRAMSGGFLARSTQGDGEDRLLVTGLGEAMLNADRRGRLESFSADLTERMLEGVGAQH